MIECDYKFQLEKTSRKHICPSCGKRTFVRYVDADNNHIDENCGRCDRSDNCGCHNPPREFIDNNEIREYKPIPPAPPRPTEFLDTKFIESGSYALGGRLYEYSMIRNNNLNYYLLDLFDWWTVKYLQDIFFIGSFTDGAITFPYIDENGKLRSLKRQQYDKETGKRSKTENSYLLHKALSGNDNFNYKGCLFGMHQIRAKYSKGKTICIVEGEKSAIIASGKFPQWLWMATGARDWFNEHSLEPIRDRKIILFPDTSKDGKTFEKWKQIADRYKAKGYDISVSDMLEKGCTQEQKEQGYDIGDLLHYELVKEKPALLTELSPEPMPEIKVDEFPPMVKEMIAANPALLNLINTFDLVAV